MNNATGKRSGPWALLAAVALGIPGCAQAPSVPHLASPITTALTGRVECAPGTAIAPVVVAIESDYLAPQVRQHRALPGCGAFELRLPTGRFIIAVFDDSNGNGRFDAGEALAEHPALVTAGGQPATAGIDIVLGTTAGPPVRATALGLDRLRRRPA